VSEQIVPEQTVPERTTVFIVDDDPALRDALSIIVAEMGLRAETFVGAQEFLDAYSPQRPGCLVLDVRMPDMSGMEMHERLIEQGCDIPVILFTAHGDVATGVDAIKRGAVDFLEKPCRPARIQQSIRKAIELDADRRQITAAKRDIDARFDLLTDDERALLDPIIAGKTNKGIARELGVSVRTVQLRQSNILRKMHAGTVAGLVTMVLPLVSRNTRES
jgi:FixJ family two-component response regulator